MKKNGSSLVEHWIAVCGRELRVRASGIHWRVFRGSSVYSKEDLYQDALLRLLRRDYPGVTTAESFLALFHRTALNHALTVYQQRGTRQKHHDQLLLQPVAEDGDAQQELRQALALASVSLLTPREQQVVWQRCEAVPHQQIARNMGLTLSRSKGVYHEAKHKLIADAQRFLN